VYYIMVTKVTKIHSATACITYRYKSNLGRPS